MPSVQGSVSRPGSRGFGEQIWSHAHCLLPSSSEITSDGPAATVPAIQGIYLSRAGFLLKESPGAPSLIPVAMFFIVSQEKCWHCEVWISLQKRVILNSLRQPRDQI